MPLNSAFVPNASSDVVGVFDQNTFEQVFSAARPIKVSVKETARAMEHPVETGATITDHLVIDPNEIELSVFLISRGNLSDYRSVYQQLVQFRKNATLLSVQTRTDTYANMLILDISHDEDAAIFDAVAVGVKLKEVLFVTPQYGNLPAANVADKKNSSTVDRGEQQTNASSDQAPSILYGGLESIFGGSK
jgi:hypothetical protein